MLYQRKTITQEDAIRFAGNPNNLRLRMKGITGRGPRVEPAELEAYRVDFLIAKPFQTKEIFHILSELAMTRA